MIKEMYSIVRDNIKEINFKKIQIYDFYDFYNFNNFNNLNKFFYSKIV